MPQRNILIVAVDGLRASALGAYGNTSFATPALDRFAADSFALDWCYAPGPDVAAAYCALWQSRHPLRPASGDDACSSLARIVSDAGLRTTLVTDEAELKSLRGAMDFNQIVEVGPSESPDHLKKRAADIAETAMARLFAAACELVESDACATGRLIWIHSRGMYGPWDAPLELQEALRDEGDPPPVEDLAPPNIILTAKDDPDAVFRYSAAYAGQVMALDVCWNGLMQAVEHSGAHDWLVTIIGARGYPLGEHGRIGGIDPRLYTEQLHVPALLRFPNGLGRLGRTGALTSQLDLLPTLADWFKSEPQQSSFSPDGMSWLPLAETARTAWRDALIFASLVGSRAIRTAEWYLRQDMSTVGQPAIPGSIPSELFVRPDDRWEANDVAKLCPDVVEALTHALDNAARLVAQNELLPVSVVPNESTSCS